MHCIRTQIGTGEYLDYRFELWKEGSIYFTSIPALKLYFVGGFDDVSRAHLHALHKIHRACHPPDIHCITSECD